MLFTDGFIGPRGELLLDSLALALALALALGAVAAVLAMRNSISNRSSGSSASHEE